MERNVLQMLQDENRFEKLADGWIKDKAFGIDWGKTFPEKMSLPEATDLFKKDGLWVPGRFESESLFDFTRHNPAIHPIFAEDTKTDDWYWTSTPVSGYASDAWCVEFHYGDVNGCRQDSTNYVRPVRASQ